MRKVPVKAGDWIIKQGDRGDRFYIIDSGKFEVRVNREKEVVTEEADAGGLRGGFCSFAFVVCFFSLVF